MAAMSGACRSRRRNSGSRTLQQAELAAQAVEIIGKSDRHIARETGSRLSSFFRKIGMPGRIHRWNTVQRLERTVEPGLLVKSSESSRAGGLVPGSDRWHPVGKTMHSENRSVNRAGPRVSHAVDQHRFKGLANFRYHRIKISFCRCCAGRACR